MGTTKNLQCTFMIKQNDNNVSVCVIINHQKTKQNKKKFTEKYIAG